jgi:hypothetical protein
VKEGDRWVRRKGSTRLWALRESVPEERWNRNTHTATISLLLGNWTPVTGVVVTTIRFGNRASLR